MRSSLFFLLLRVLLLSHIRLVLVFKLKVLQDQVDELQSELEEFRAQGKVLRLPLKNSLSEELDVSRGRIEPDQGKPFRHHLFRGCAFRFCF